MIPSDPSLLDRARNAAKVIAPLAPRIEADRKLPPEAILALQEARVFHLAVPRKLGGEEATPETILGAIEAIAEADGSAGWCTMIGATSALMSGFLPEATAREVYGSPEAITCGVFAPMGRARREGGGLRVSGRWPFASGCEHARFRMGGVLVEEDPPDVLPGGGPHVRSVLFRAEDTRIIDTWNTIGLRGTGSHDLEVKDVLVPEDRVFSFFTTRPWPESPLYRLPMFGLLAAGIASVALGIARGASTNLVALAATKKPGGAKRGIAHRELVQLAVASAEAKIRAGRAFLHEAIGEATAGGGAEAGAELRARALLRAAAYHATTEAAAAVDLLYEAGGGTSIYSASPLQRAFRDVHTATAHVMVQKTSAVLAGRILLGLETDTSTL